jgi:hypothetical protein
MEKCFKRQIKLSLYMKMGKWNEEKKIRDEEMKMCERKKSKILKIWKRK